MSIDGVSASNAMQIQTLVSVRRQIDDLQRQLGTGRKADTYSGLGASRGLTIGLNTQLAAIDSYNSSITLAGTRMSIAQTALTQIDSSAHAVKNATANAGFALDQSGQTQAQKTAFWQLDEIVGALKSQVMGQYIFSGKAADQPSVVTTDEIINGKGPAAGLKQLIAERNQADLGTGSGRLSIPPAAGNTVSIAEDVAGSPFGFKIASVQSSLTGAVVSGPTGSTNAVGIDLTAATLAPGDTIKFTLTLPDGTTEDLTLTATNSSTPGANEFTIGGSAAATATNLQAALSTSVGAMAQTELAAASAFAAADDFFNIDAANPPRRVAGPPFASATTLAAGTTANTVFWYQGEAGSDPARSTAVARVDSALNVNFGLRANEQGIRNVVANAAVFAAMSFSASDPNAEGRYVATSQRVTANLGIVPGTQQVSDIASEIATAQVTMNSARDRHQQTSTALSNLLEELVGVPSEQVGSQLIALQSQLEASLRITAMMAQTNLVQMLG